MRIEPVAPQHLHDLDVLFSSGDPRSCQCAWNRLTNAEYQRSNPANNRDVHHGAVRAAAADGRAAGLIAYDDDGPIGWVSFSPREEYARLTSSRTLAAVDDQAVWSVTCFVVARRARRQGVASALLAETVSYARAHGVRLLEGYPVDKSGIKPSAASLWRGTLSMFEAAGFKAVALRQQNARSAPRPIVRLELT
jgi:GNAT superfamily N-acetyltransferase